MTCSDNLFRNWQAIGSCEPANVFFSKTVQPEILRSCGTVKYAITIENYSKKAITDVTIKDPTLSCFLSVSNLRLNGAPVPDSQDLFSGVVIPFMPSLSGARVTFDACLLPGAPCRITNVAEAAYCYPFDGNSAVSRIRSCETAFEILKS